MIDAEDGFTAMLATVAASMGLDVRLQRFDRDLPDGADLVLVGPALAIPATAHALSKPRTRSTRFRVESVLTENGPAILRRMMLELVAEAGRVTATPLCQLSDRCPHPEAPPCRTANEQATDGTGKVIRKVA